MFSRWIATLVMVVLRACGPVLLLACLGCGAQGADLPPCVTLGADAQCLFATTDDDGTSCCRGLAP
jgi:hypothetical protein